MKSLLAVVAFGIVFAVGTPRQEVKPVPTPPVVMPKPQAPPSINEIAMLRIQNALLQANAEKQRFDQRMKDLGAVIDKEVAAFEKEHDGWTIDMTKLVAVKKPAKTP